MTLREEWLRDCEPEPSDGPTVLRVKAILRGELPGEALAEVVYLPTYLNQRLADESEIPLKVCDMPIQRREVLWAVGASAGCDRRVLISVKHFLDPFLKAHETTFSRLVSGVKVSQAASARALSRALRRASARRASITRSA